MQLPRGTFLKIKKRELVSSILDELERTKFSGICSVSYGPVSGTLVFKSGKCILAKVHHKSGDGAWDELQKMSGHETDAALSSLDEAQIQLALEFNKPCRVIKTGKTTPSQAPQPHKHASAVHHEPAGKPVAPSRTAAPVTPDASPDKPASVASPTLRPSSSFASPPARTAAPPQPSVTVKPYVQPPVQPLTAKKPAAPASATPQIPVRHPQEPEKPAETEETPPDSSSFEKDIDTFDTLDIDNVTDKIRNDCKTIIKQLQLEHLMER